MCPSSDPHPHLQAFEPIEPPHALPVDRRARNLADAEAAERSATSFDSCDTWPRG
jgi:hypothetical protein